MSDNYEPPQFEALRFPGADYDRWKCTPPEDPFEDPDETSAELHERILRTTARAKKWIAEWDAAAKGKEIDG